VKSFFTPLFMSSVGNHRQIALTQVTPSAQAVIKAGCHTGHLRSSTITEVIPDIRHYFGFLSRTRSQTDPAKPS